MSEQQGVIYILTNPSFPDYVKIGYADDGVWKNNCVNANKPEKRTKAKNAAKQGNAGERPDAAARYTVKSSGANSLLFYFTGIFQRINSGVRGRAPSWS